MWQTYVDAAIDGVYTAASTVLGAMTVQGQVTLPNKATLLAAVLTGIVGAANQLRALNKPSPGGPNK